MGHVDHGKTTLLDYIRKTRVADREAGGITQVIGAYEIEHAGRLITFIDTPGHEAFAKMREHSAKVADLAILIVAADDGVKPQTLNALQFITEAKIPYVVAINKVDKSNADIKKTHQTLLTAGVYLEGSGGNVSYQEISAKTGEGITELLDLVLLTADMEDLSTDAHGIPTGIVLTSKLDPRKGNVVGVIIKDGTLRPGELIPTETAKGKIKVLSSFTGDQVKSLPASAPALIIGFEKLPAVGEIFFAGESAAEFCKVGNNVLPITREEISETATTVILKAEESGSLEALKGIICKMQNKNELVILSASVGDIYEGDIKLAKSAHAIILGFKSKIDKAAQNVARNEHVEILLSNIIYELESNFLKLLGQGFHEPERVLDVLKVFNVGKGKDQVVGGKVTKGEIKNQESFVIWKNREEIGSGRILNLQAGHADAKSVPEGQEAGLLIESETTIQPGMQLIFPNL
jgi:translation initiation factor IF-2